MRDLYLSNQFWKDLRREYSARSEAKKNFNDLVLIYRKYDKKAPHKQYGDHALVLARLGSHSELDL
jgi:mRNA-degrading endonuclease YafQ of YafQ-DinJ toxin-antitoxin module